MHADQLRELCERALMLADTIEQAATEVSPVTLATHVAQDVAKHLRQLAVEAALREVTCEAERLPCPGIELAPGQWSGCTAALTGATDCPRCGQGEAGPASEARVTGLESGRARAARVRSEDAARVYGGGLQERTGAVLGVSDGKLREIIAGAEVAQARGDERAAIRAHLEEHLRAVRSRQEGLRVEMVRESGAEETLVRQLGFLRRRDEGQG